MGPHARQQANHAHDRLRLHPAPASGGAWRLARRMVRASTDSSPTSPSPSPTGTSGSSPSPAATASGSRPAVTPALTAYRAESQAALSTNGLSREVLGFAPYWELSSAGGWNLGTLSAIAYFGLDVRSDGSFDTSSSNPGYQGWTSQEFASLVAAAHQHGVRVLLVVEQLDPATVNAIVTNPAAISAAAANTVSAIQSMGLDGVDVDLEGTSQGYPNARSGMVDFMAQVSQSVRQSLPSAEIVIDTYTGSAGCNTCFFDVGGIAPYVDAFDVMAYDMAQSNTPGQASPNAPLKGWTYNDTMAVSQYLAALGDPSKVILGVPYYGYKWSTTSNQPYASITGGEESDTYAGLVSEFGCMEQLSRQWDATGASPWASWWSPGSNDPCGGNWNSWREADYDDAQSLGSKYDLVDQQGLRGVGIWALGYDGGLPDLQNELVIKFVPGAMAPVGTVTAGPAVASWAPGRLDVFVRGADGGLWHRWWDGSSWSWWEALGGQLAPGTGPGAVSWGPNRIDVFVEGTDGGLWHRCWDGSSWSWWEPLGGQLTAGPAVASWALGRLDVFVRGADGGLWHRWWGGSSWNGWEPLGGQLASGTGPGAVSWGPNRIDVFVEGADGGLWHRWWGGSSWNGWQPLGGQLTAGPAVASWALGRLDVFVRGADGGLWHRWWGGSSWSGWESQGGQLASGTGPGAVSWGPNRIDVFLEGLGGQLWHEWWGGSGWSGWEPHVL
ncbi:MAG TPA: glycosyl hydrolase family 18 protein [Candidatus Dormibacteraeota bacterium]|nr:glycosyl hydrolase family 18 protein [Candidatus Dormibacteraeota bacterium]